MLRLLTSKPVFFDGCSLVDLARESLQSLVDTSLNWPKDSREKWERNTFNCLKIKKELRPTAEQLMEVLFINQT